MYSIDPSLNHAGTLPASFYQDPNAWELSKKRIFSRNWLYLGHEDEFQNGPENVHPRWLLENFLDEPVLVVREDQALRCLTNVCTHRGFLLAQHPAKMNRIVCQYHGRRFDLAGKFEAMPEFEEAADFPRPCDHLHQLPLEQWGPFLFTQIDSQVNFSVIRNQLEERLGFLPLQDMVYHPEYSKTYNVKAHWALYCDNYLEGFHIPFVHMDLRGILDYGDYSTEVGDGMVLQVGYSNGKSFTFDLPEGHSDFGKDVTAYYYWIFPNIMLNVYPWGIQVNQVRPVTANFTKIDFWYYIWDHETFELMDGLQLAEKTEREDEFVVEAVQRGLRSRFYPGGRFSPKREAGVHYFHRLIAEAMNAGD